MIQGSSNFYQGFERGTRGDIKSSRFFNPAFMDGTSLSSLEDTWKVERGKRKIPKSGNFLLESTCSIQRKRFHSKILSISCVFSWLGGKLVGGKKLHFSLLFFSWRSYTRLK